MASPRLRSEGRSRPLVSKTCLWGPQGLPLLPGRPGFKSYLFCITLGRRIKPPCTSPVILVLFILKKGVGRILRGKCVLSAWHVKVPH